MERNDFLNIYNQGRQVPDEAKKPFDNGTFKGTDINPMWRIKKLTELFGPVGFGWYYEVLSERCEEHLGTTMAFVDLNLYVKYEGEWSKPIYGTGGNSLVKETKNGSKTSDEGYKMALTDALSVACKALGIGADVYWEKDKTKYTSEFAPTTTQKQTEAPGVVNDTQKTTTAEKEASTGQIEVVGSEFATRLTKLIEGTKITIKDLNAIATRDYGTGIAGLTEEQREDLYNKTYYFIHKEDKK